MQLNFKCAMHYTSPCGITYLSFRILAIIAGRRWRNYTNFEYNLKVDTFNLFYMLTCNI